MRLSFVACFFCLICGCWYTQMTTGMVSTRDIEFGKPGKSYRIDATRKVCGYDRKHMICIIPTGVPSPEEAIDKALDCVYGAYPVVGLAYAQVRTQWFYIPYIYGQQWYSAEGYPIYEIARKSEPVASEVKGPVKQTSESEQSRAHEKNREKIPADGLDDLPF